MARNNTATIDENPVSLGDFDSILDRSADEIKEPSRAPNGPWVLRMTGFYIRKTPAEDLEDNPDLPLGKVMFYHTPHEPLDGVDPEAVEAGDWRGKRITTTRSVKEVGDDYKVLQLVKLHGVDTEGRTLREALNACKGRFIRGTVSQYSYDRRDTGETVTQNQIGNFAPVGE